MYVTRYVTSIDFILLYDQKYSLPSKIEHLPYTLMVSDLHGFLVSK